jgi:hypothetical protein
MTVVISVTDDEVREVAAFFGAEALVMSPAVGLSPRVAFTVKKMEKVGDKEVNVGVDQDAFRALMCDRFGDRPGFRYTHVAQSWDGEDRLIEYRLPEAERAPRGPLSDEHKAAMQEGRRKAAEAKKTLTEKSAPRRKVQPVQPTDKRGAKTQTPAPQADSEFYTSASCRACGGPIRKTGKKGRPPVFCSDKCRSDAGQTVATPERPFGDGFYKTPCTVCGEPIAFTGTRGKQPSKHEGCVTQTNGHAAPVVQTRVVKRAPAKKDATIEVPVGMSALEALKLLKGK